MNCRDYIGFFIAFLFFIATLSLPFGRVAHSEEISSLRQGIFDYKAESFEEALPTLLKALDEDPSSATAAYYIGLTYKEILDYDKARTYLEKTVSLDPSLGDAYLNLGEVLYELEFFQKAEAALAEVEKLGIKPGRTAYLRGLILLKMGESNRAIEEFKRAISVDETFKLRATYSIGKAYLNRGMLKEGQEAFEEVIVLAPESDMAIMARRGIPHVRAS